MALFNSLGNAKPNNFMNMMQKYKECRQTFSGNPEQIIQQKLQSGEITQQQLEQAKAMMKQFSQFIK